MSPPRPARIHPIGFNSVGTETTTERCRECGHRLDEHYEWGCLVGWGPSGDQNTGCPCTVWGAA